MKKWNCVWASSGSAGGEETDRNSEFNEENHCQQAGRVHSVSYCGNWLKVISISGTQAVADLEKFTWGRQSQGGEWFPVDLPLNPKSRDSLKSELTNKFSLNYFTKIF